jgi:hypothetical protein
MPRNRPVCTALFSSDDQRVAIFDHLMLGDLQAGKGLAEASLQVGQRDVQAEGPAGEPEAVLDPAPR